MTISSTPDDLYTLYRNYLASDGSIPVPPVDESLAKFLGKYTRPILKKRIPQSKVNNLVRLAYQAWGESGEEKVGKKAGKIYTETTGKWGCLTDGSSVIHFDDREAYEEWSRSHDLSGYVLLTRYGMTNPGIRSAPSRGTPRRRTYGERGQGLWSRLKSYLGNLLGSWGEIDTEKKIAKIKHKQLRARLQELYENGDREGVKNFFFDIAEKYAEDIEGRVDESVYKALDKKIKDKDMNGVLSLVSSIKAGRRASYTVPMAALGSVVPALALGPFGLLLGGISALTYGGYGLKNAYGWHKVGYMEEAMEAAKYAYISIVPTSSE